MVDASAAGAGDSLPYGGGHPVLSPHRGAIDLAGFTALTPLSPTLRLREGAGLHWRLLSHLKLGHLSLADGAGGPGTLREMLRLYDYRDAPETHALIDAITGVGHRRSTARVAGGGMARGRWRRSGPCAAWPVPSHGFRGVASRCESRLRSSVAQACDAKR